MNDVKETIELTITPDYVDWNTWEAVREFLQNAKDAHDRGYSGTVDYNEETRRLIICNEGVVLPKSSLLLGMGTKKDDDSQIGQFGEGYKLALGALCRLDKSVVIRTGTQEWSPSIVKSKQFGTDVISIDIDYLMKDHHGTFICINGITVEEWEEISNNVLWLDPVDSALSITTYDIGESSGDFLFSCDNGDIIRNGSGNLYCKGIYVGPLGTSGLKYDYNLNNVKLDRDRRIANNYDATSRIRDVLSEMSYEEMMEFATLEEFIGGAKDICMIADWWCSAVHCHYYTAFMEEYGGDSYPYHYHDNRADIEDIGLTPVEVPNVFLTVMQRSPLDSIALLRREYYSNYSIMEHEDIEEEEREVLNTALIICIKHNEYLAGRAIKIASFPEKGVKSLVVNSENDYEANPIVVNIEAMRSGLGSTICALMLNGDYLSVMTDLVDNHLDTIK